MQALQSPSSMLIRNLTKKPFKLNQDAKVPFNLMYTEQIRDVNLVILVPKKFNHKTSRQTSCIKNQVATEWTQQTSQLR